MASSSSLVFTGAVILPDRLLENGAVVCRDGRIVAVGPGAEVQIPAGARVVDAQDGFIGPGYVDIHVHGGGGADFMDGTAEAVRIANRAGLRT